MINLWRALKLVLPHRGMLFWYMCTAFALAICGSAPLILANTFIDHLNAVGKVAPRPVWPGPAPAVVEAAEVAENPRAAVKDTFGIKKYVTRTFADFNYQLKVWSGSEKNYIFLLCGLILFALASKALFDFLNTFIGSWLAQRLRIEAIERVMAKVVSLDIPFHDSRNKGDLVTRMVSDGENLRKTVKIFLDFAQQPFLIIALISVALYYDWRLFLMGAIGVPLMMYPLITIVRKITRQSKKYQEKTADIAQEMLQNLDGIRVIHAYGAEALEAKGFQQLTRGLFRIGMKRSWNRAIQRPLTSVLMCLGGVVVLGYGGYRITQDPVKHPVASFLTFIFALGMLYDPVTAVTQTIGEIAEYLPNAERIFEILDVKPTIVDAPDAIICPAMTKEIVFENVCFNYGKTVVLRDFNLRLRFGEKLGIVGKTGVGKSTLLSLLLRFYDPTSGRILIDGVDIRAVKLASLRQQVGLVTQRPFLFNATVAENIRYGREGASDEDVIDAAKAAMVHDEILKKPLGYNELCGERGGELYSGGQQQRITIARALLRNPPILLLDEATSALDALKERSLQEAFDKLEANRTCLIVAHRLSTLSNANRILVFGDEGGVEAIGTHTELMEKSVTYRQMWNVQNAQNANQG